MAGPEGAGDPWLVAVWPGMGSVAFLAGSYLLDKLKVRRAAELDTNDFFEIQSVNVKNGVLASASHPRSLFFEWKHPRGGRDLLIFIGEAQPSAGGYALCQKIIEYASRRGVKRFFTFAAMATQLQLGTNPRVFAVSTDAASLAQVTRVGAEALEDGQISGLNGVLLAAGAERGLRGTCLLGELPFFAIGLPNPRAAQAVLECFTSLANIEIDFTGLEQQAIAVERNLEELVEQMSQSGEQDESTDGDEEDSEPEKSRQSDTGPLDARTQRRVEALFSQARQDRSKAFELKRELDRLGVFKQYEDRFLDLFRKGE